MLHNPAIERSHPCGVAIQDTLCWPKIAAGVARPARTSPDDWVQVCRDHGIRRGDTVEFLFEDVLDRFKLCVQADQSYCTDAAYVPEWDGATFVTCDGDSADSLDGLIAQCVANNPSWMYPLSYQCRVVLIRPPTAYVMVLRQGRFRFEPAGGRHGRGHRHRLDG